MCFYALQLINKQLFIYRNSICCGIVITQIVKEQKSKVIFAPLRSSGTRD